MNSLTQLQHRKAELKAQIEQQRLDLTSTFLEVRKEIEPSFLLKKALQGMFRQPKGSETEGFANFFERFPLPVSFLVDLFVKNKAIAAFLKLFAPAALKFIPRLFNDQSDTESGTGDTTKARLYGSLRQAVSSLRNQLKLKEKQVVDAPETSEN